MRHVMEYSANVSLLTMPSAVHLTACISTRFSATRILCTRMYCCYLCFNGLRNIKFGPTYTTQKKMSSNFFRLFGCKLDVIHPILRPDIIEGLLGFGGNVKVLEPIRLRRVKSGLVCVVCMACASCLAALCNDRIRAECARGKAPMRKDKANACTTR